MRRLLAASVFGGCSAGGCAGDDERRFASDARRHREYRRGHGPLRRCLTQHGVDPTAAIRCWLRRVAANAAVRPVAANQVCFAPHATADSGAPGGAGMRRQRGRGSRSTRRNRPRGRVQSLCFGTAPAARSDAMSRRRVFHRAWPTGVPIVTQAPVARFWRSGRRCVASIALAPLPRLTRSVACCSGIRARRSARRSERHATRDSEAMECSEAMDVQ